MLIPVKYIYWLIDENLIIMMALMAPICLPSVRAYVLRRIGFWISNTKSCTNSLLRRGRVWGGVLTDAYLGLPHILNRGQMREIFKSQAKYFKAKVATFTF